MNFEKVSIDWSMEETGRWNGWDRVFSTGSNGGPFPNRTCSPSLLPPGSTRTVEVSIVESFRYRYVGPFRPRGIDGGSHASATWKGGGFHVHVGTSGYGHDGATKPFGALLLAP